MRTAVEAGGNGVVLVAMHAPPINPKRHEYPHHFRETEHQTTDRENMNGYLLRADPYGFMTGGAAKNPDEPHPDWIRSGTRHFKTGPHTNLMDFGVSRGPVEQLLEVCVGAGGLRRKVNAILCGHGHKRVEFRLTNRGTAEMPGFGFHMDFYTENPEEYYRTLFNKKVTKIVKFGVVVGLNVEEIGSTHVKVTTDPRYAGKVVTIHDGREGAVWKSYRQIDVAPWNDPLNSSPEPARWWQAMSPLIIQTAALGPTTNTRPDLKVNPERPNPVFQGFRLLTISGSTISQIRYVTMPELRARTFRMPWEPTPGVRTAPAPAADPVAAPALCAAPNPAAGEPEPVEG